MVALRMMRFDEERQPVPPPVVMVAESHSSTGRSVETVVVVVAVITIVGIIAGMIARLCGGRHYGGNHEMEGWVESRCKSCIDGGLSSAPPPKEVPKSGQHDNK
ncbi:hypothetical protein Ccrd_018201 [Cynara cardunculus var. scolymus]|uniref:Transmembrane protein n=1 Tax=Cynara cardunculus var. scolymus TaxID=59895 RepID=A0A103Y6M9_CYNCS|nr:hypothetical protein Ccrd_018201 [Cynara cardunculus var. scolymus]